MKKIILIIFSLLLITTTCLLYINNNNEVKEQSNQLAIVVDGEEVSDFPAKTNAVFEKVICKNNSTGTWDNDTWSLSMSFTDDDSCVVYFKGRYVPTLPQTGTDVLDDLLVHNVTFLVNDDPDQNVRYVGSNPDNYILFNGEKWRIIGAFNNIKTTESGTGETRLKIIGPEQTDKEWDEDNFNDWSTSSLQEELNGTYYEALSSDAKALISETVWNLGGHNTSSSTAETFYNAERGTNVYTGRLTIWTGNVALMYPSDYGYATSGGATKNRESCLSNVLRNWREIDYNDCKTNDYLYNSNNRWWTLTIDSSNSRSVFDYSNSGYLNSDPTIDAFSINPTLYLKSEVQIVSGSGTNEDPYILGL